MVRMHLSHPIEEFSVCGLNDSEELNRNSMMNRTELGQKELS